MLSCNRSLGALCACVGHAAPPTPVRVPTTPMCVCLAQGPQAASGSRLRMRSPEWPENLNTLNSTGLPQPRLRKKLGISHIAAIFNDLCLWWAGLAARMAENRLPRRFETNWVPDKWRNG